MIWLEKWKILTPLQKLPTTVGNLDKIVFAQALKSCPKVQKIAQSGHTDATSTVKLARDNCTYELVDTNVR